MLLDLASTPVTVPLPPVHATTIRLHDGSELQVLPTVPASAAERRQAVSNSTLYVIAGRLTSAGWLTGYVGLSATLHHGRAAWSYRNWVIAQRKIAPVGMALLRRPRRPYPADQLKLTESLVMRRLSTDLGMLALTNRQTTAQLAAARLTQRQAREAGELADAVATHVWQLILGGRHNPWPAPAPNAREQAVRIVLRAGALEHRPLTAEEVTTRLLALGHHTQANNPVYSTLRDLGQREPLPENNRIQSATYRHRRLFFPIDMSLRQATAGFDRAHPRHSATSWRTSA